MISIEDTIVSTDILDEQFVCDLVHCKGACCVEGDAGAPLEQEELPILKKYYPDFKSFLTKKGQQAIEQQGVFVKAEDGSLETPLIEGKECAYICYDKGTAKCGIEEAYNKGVVPWQKPLSCHLYPIRISNYKNFKAVNYHRWDICNVACTLGKSLKIKIYVFLKTPLIRCFGKAWYENLEQVAKEYRKQKSN